MPGRVPPGSFYGLRPHGYRAQIRRRHWHAGDRLDLDPGEETEIAHSMAWGGRSRLVAVSFRCPAKEIARANKSSPAEMSRTAKAAGEIKGLPG